MTVDGSILIGARDVRHDTVFYAVEAASGTEALQAFAEANASNVAQLAQVIADLEGQLTATLQLDPDDVADAAPVLALLQTKVGRLLTTQDGDVFEIEADACTLPVRNPLMCGTGDTATQVRFL